MNVGTHFGRLIGVLSSAGVDFVVVGGVALVSRGGSRLTQDLDVVYEALRKASDP